MLEDPKVSVIVTTYNRKSILKGTIDSILSQTFDRFELIIIDNFSDFNFFKLIKSYNDNRIKAFQNSNNGIIAANRNFGIKKAISNYIAFCDDDDCWTKDKLEISFETINKSNLDIVYHDMFYIINGGKNIFKKKYSRDLIGCQKEDLLKNGNGIINSSVLVKKEVLFDVKLISEDLDKVTWEDFHTWIKIAEKGYKFKRIKKALGYYRISTSNNSSLNRTINNLKNIKNYYKEFYKGISPWWMDYIISRAAFNEGNYYLSIKRLNSVKTEKLNIKIKILLFKILLSLKMLKFNFS